MAKSKLVGLVFESWNDMDRVLDNLDPWEAIQQIDGSSSFAWTLAHVTSVVDAWVNVRFQGQAANLLISQQRFGLGSTGAAEDWEDISRVVVEVRERARRYLEDMAENELDSTVSYDGSMLHLREVGLSLRYALLRICAHHYYHIGQIAAKRSHPGRAVGEYPGRLEECV